MTRLGLVFVVALVACSAEREPVGADEANETAHSGLADTSYGNDGMVTAAVAGVPVVAFSPAGRMAWAPRNTRRLLKIHGYTADGKPDPTQSFETEIADADIFESALRFEMVAHDDGSIVLYGGITQQGHPRSFVARVKNGGFDPSFGADGILRVEDGHGWIHRLVETRDGAYAIQYVDLPEMRLIKLSAAGVIDRSFGDGGFVKLVSSTSTALFVDADGSVRVMRPSGPDGSLDSDTVLTQRFTSAGIPDGTATAKIDPASWPRMMPLANGDVITAWRVPTGTRLTRFSPKGALIDLFPGRKSVDMPNRVEVLSASSAGHLYVRNDDKTLARWKADGAVDTTFADQGAFHIPPAEHLGIAKLTSAGAVMVVTHEAEALHVRRLSPSQ